MDSQTHLTEAFLTWINTEGHSDARVIPGNQYACIRRFAFTFAILTGKIGDFTSYTNRWCYCDYAKARNALDAWDGIGEPVGWHRHPATGRRVATSDIEIDGSGKLVPIGEAYIRI